jgi:hypothetical protein
MGVYVHPACHTCRIILDLPAPFKVAEILADKDNLKEIGIFFMQHDRHQIGLVADESYGHYPTGKGYKRVKPQEPKP